MYNSQNYFNILEITTGVGERKHNNFFDVWSITVKI